MHVYSASYYENEPIIQVAVSAIICADLLVNII